MQVLPVLGVGWYARQFDYAAAVVCAQYGSEELIVVFRMAKRL